MTKKITRRTLLKAGLGAGTALGLGGLGAWQLMKSPPSPPFVPAPAPSSKVSPSKAPRVIVVSIDSLDPRYLDLDADGNAGGRDGNWLMPNVRRFLGQGVWFEHARCHMPAITDPNHLNALAGASIAQTGINSVSLQFFDWQEDGRAMIVPPSLSMARDDQGRPVDTLFSAWKRKWPGSKTFYVSGKQWVAGMFDVPGSGVDIVMGGSKYPNYIDAPPKGYKFYDPPGDLDEDDYAESEAQKTFSRVAYERNPGHFPRTCGWSTAF